MLHLLHFYVNGESSCVINWPIRSSFGSWRSAAKILSFPLVQAPQSNSHDATWVVNHCFLCSPSTNCPKIIDQLKCPPCMKKWSCLMSNWHGLQYLSYCDIIKLKTVAIFMHGGHFNQEKSMIFRQFASEACCVQSFMLAQKCKVEISEFWPKLTFLPGQQTKYVCNTQISAKVEIHMNHLNWGILVGGGDTNSRG